MGSISKFVFANNVQSRIEVPIGPADTLLQLVGPTAPANHPADPADGGMDSSAGVLTLVNSLTNPTKMEIVSYESRLITLGDQCLLTLSGRGLEGTTAQSWSPGEFAVQALTAESIQSPVFTTRQGPGSGQVVAAVTSATGTPGAARLDVDGEVRVTTHTIHQQVDGGEFTLHNDFYSVWGEGGPSIAPNMFKWKAGVSEISGEIVWTLDRITGGVAVPVITARRANSWVGFGLPAGQRPESPVDINFDRLRIRNSFTPATSTSPGKQGDVSWSSTHLHIAIGDNNWKRVALSTF